MTAPDLPPILADLIAERLGLSASVPYSNMLVPALVKLAAATGADPDRLADALKARSFFSDEWQTLIGALTVGETRFLRQRTWFEQIERTILAPLVARRASQNQKHLRIWCAGCSTGEEPYTIAMLLRRLIADPDSWTISILASDIRRDAIATALGGEYPGHQFRELDDDLMGRFCTSVADRRYSIAPDVLGMVQFELGNLADVGPGNPHYDGGPYDLIICRNVIMYMVPEMQRRIARRLCGSLSDEGWIAVSAAEAVAEWFRPLDPVNAGEAILFCKKDRGSPRIVKLPSARTTETPLPRKEPEMPPERLHPVEAQRIAVEPRGLDYIRGIADAGRLDEAAALCRELVQRDNMNGQAAILLAAILIEVGDHNAALESARRAVYLEPVSVTALNLLAGALLNLGHRERARRAFAAAERLAEGLAAAAALLSDRAARATGVFTDEMDHADGA
jgi:chemotaxis protein methyltransferase CheR